MPPRAKSALGRDCAAYTAGFVPGPGSKLPDAVTNCRCTYFSNANFPVPIRPGGTPVPIPNTTVKPRAADGTELETVWESRRAPEFKKRILPAMR